MLTVVRSVQESVVVGEDDGPHRVLKVTILGIHGNRVKLGFEVDSEAAVHRWEVWEHIRDGADRSEAGPSVRTAFNSWLNHQARRAARVVTLAPQEEVTTDA